MAAHKTHRIRYQFQGGSSTRKEAHLSARAVTYSVTMYEGYKQIKAAKISTAVRKYRKEIFLLYSSFKGGAAGKSVNVDKRQNMFGNRGLLVGMVAVLIVGGLSVKTVNGVDLIGTEKQAKPDKLPYVYRPKYRDVNYLVELVRALFHTPQKRLYRCRVLCAVQRQPV